MANMDWVKKSGSYNYFFHCFLWANGYDKYTYFISQTSMENNNQHIMNGKNDRIFFWAMCIILFLPIILLPPDFQPSDFSRAILFRLIMTALVVFVGFKFLSKKEISISLPKKKNLAFLPLLALFGFLLTLVISTVFSENIKLSIFGVPTRTGGLLNLFFILMFPVFAALFVKKARWDKLLKINLAVGALAAAFAIVQFFNIFKNLFISFEGGRTPSFLGNSTFLAIYLLFLSFSCLVFLIQEKNTKKKILYAGLLALFLFTIFITAARATYLGFTVGLIFFLLFYPNKMRGVKIITSSFLVFVILIVGLFNFFPQIAQQNSLLAVAANRLSISSIATDLAGNRFAAWQITLKAIQERPILGWGLENFYVGFEKYYDPALSNIQGLWWDRPHNIFLDIFATSGIFALIFYIAFWALLLWGLQKYKKQQGDSNNAYVAHGIQAMFIGYFTALFFNFDSFATYITAFFFAGYSLYLLSEQEEKTAILPPKTALFQSKPVIISFLAILTVFVWFWHIKPFYINGKISHIALLSNSQKCARALALADGENWQKAGILKSYAALKYSDLVKKCAQDEAGAEYSKKALDLLRVGAVHQPEFTRTWLFMGSFTNVLAAAEKNPAEQEKILKEARGYFEKALTLSPKRAEIMVEQQKNYLLAKDYAAMQKLGENCIATDPKQYGCYWYLGIAQIFLGDQVNGKKNIKLTGRIVSYLQLGVAYMSQKNYADAADAYYELLKQFPDNASYHATLAFLYKQNGNYKEAAREAVAVFKLQPENEETMKFIKSLLGLSPGDPTLHLSLAFIYQESGENEKALQEVLTAKNIYRQLIVQDYRNSNHHWGLAHVYQQLDEYEKSYQEALITLKLAPARKLEVEVFIEAELKGIYWDRYNKGRDPTTGLY